MKSLLCRLLSLVLILSLVLGVVPALEKQTVQAASISASEMIQDGVTLHCWNWSFANIEANMSKIASLGYTSIQVSPIQQAKQKTAGYSMSDWWVYYQPASFSIDNTGNSALGNKAQFRSMCAAAHKYGIYVIVDVVANHMGDNGSNKKSSAIIDDLENDSSCWHDISKNIENYYDRYHVTQYCLDGVPDLNTGSAKVQNYVLNFLKECVDAGADGFRFDAVKHIETPEDSHCASNFWPTVINGIKSYDPDVYCYGELLWHPDEGGSLSDKAYTKYFSVTDNSWSNTVRNEVIGNGNAGAFSYGYHKDATADQLIVWAESHDNYAGDGSSGMSIQNINKTWALVAARADAMGLYLARPQNMYPQKLGEVTTGGWDSNEVEQVNKFHNAFAGQSEWVANEGGIAYVERGTSGVVLVNCGGTSGSVNVKANVMADGTYQDQITGNTFQVSDGRIKGNIGSTGVAVVYNVTQCAHPSHNATGLCLTCRVMVGHSYDASGVCSCGAVKPQDRVVYFKNTASWSSVNIYSWYSGGDSVTGVWPGASMSEVEDNIYSYTLPGDVENVIFNNGTAQTDDLLLPDSSEGKNLYDYSTGSWSYYDDGTRCDHVSHDTDGKCTACGATVGHSYVGGVCACGATKPAEGLDYYLIGYINGADYGDGDDYANMGEYSFKNGPVTVTFTEDSYVCVKNAANTTWYMTDGWQGEVNSVKLYDSSSLDTSADKLYVPGGAEVTFTLDENDDGTLTLSYVIGGEVCSHESHSVAGKCNACGATVAHVYVDGVCSCGATEPVVTMPDYYLFGWIGGQNYACEEDAANMGSYKLVNGQLVTTFETDVYVAVKSADNSRWYMTNGWQGQVQSVTLYNTSVTQDMSDKLYIPGGMKVKITLVDNGNDSFTLSYEEYVPCQHSSHDGNGDCIACGEAVGHDYNCVTTAPTCTESGYATYTCVCGDSYTADEVAATGHSYEDGVCSVCGEKEPVSVIVPTLNLDHPSLSFEGEIMYNLYFTADDLTSVVEMGLISFNEKLESGTIENADNIYPGYITAGSLYMGQSEGVPARYLGDAVYFKAYAKLSDGSYVYSGMAGYNAAVYAKSILNNSTNDYMKRLVVAMINYGAEAQGYFCGKEGVEFTPMNDFLTADQQAMISAYDASMVADLISVDASKATLFTYNTGDFAKRSNSVSFDGAFAINYYFTAKGTPDNGMKFYYWNTADYEAADVLAPENATGTMDMVAGSDNQYWGQISGIAAKEVDQTYFVAGVYELDGVTYTTGILAYSLGKYCARLAAGTTEQQALSAATAVYGYYAKEYFANI